MSRADLNQKKIVDALRSIGATVEITSQQGNGFPDLVVGYMKRTHLIEVKNPDTNGKLRATQEIFRDKWKGSDVHVVNTVDEALRVVGIEV
jgi:hypothetical protein